MLRAQSDWLQNKLICMLLLQAQSSWIANWEGHKQLLFGEGVPARTPTVAQVGQD